MTIDSLPFATPIAQPSLPPDAAYAGRQESFNAYLWALEREHPDVYELISPTRAADAGREIARMDAQSWEFEDQSQGGRGEAYNKAQEEPSGRSTGMLALLQLFSPSFRDRPASHWRILDVLGGDGTVARLAPNAGFNSCIVTADISEFMVQAALIKGLPAIRQAAGYSFFDDNSWDGILIGYGTHHLGDPERDASLSEAYRTLRPGRRVIVHDFEEETGDAAWFHRVVHPFSRTGHPHRHFTKSEMLDRFVRAGFTDIRIMNMPDPFTVFGATPEAARLALLGHLHTMYDLVRFDADDWPALLAELVEATLGPIQVVASEGRYVAIAPRTALVAVGTK